MYLGLGGAFPAAAAATAAAATRLKSQSQLHLQPQRRRRRRRLRRKAAAAAAGDQSRGGTCVRNRGLCARARHMHDDDGLGGASI